MADLEAELEETNNQLFEQSRHLDELRTSAEAASKRSQDLETTLKLAERSLHTSEGERQAYSEQIVLLSEQNSEFEQQVAELESQQSRLEQAERGLRQMLEQERERAQKMEDELHRTQQKLAATRRETERQAQELEQRDLVLQQQSSALAGATSDLEIASESRDRLMSQVEMLGHEKLSVEAAERESREQLEALQAKLRETEARAENLEKEMATQDLELKSAKGALESARDASSRLARARREQSRLLSQAIESLDSGLSTLDAEAPSEPTPEAPKVAKKKSATKRKTRTSSKKADEDASSSAPRRTSSRKKAPAKKASTSKRRASRKASPAKSTGSSNRAETPATQGSAEQSSGTDQRGAFEDLMDELRNVADELSPAGRSNSLGEAQPVDDEVERSVTEIIHVEKDS